MASVPETQPDDATRQPGEEGNYYTGGNRGVAHMNEPGQHPGNLDDDPAHPQGAFGATPDDPGPPPTPREVAAEASSDQTAAGASAPLSQPALDATQGPHGPVVSEADPTSNAG